MSAENEEIYYTKEMHIADMYKHYTDEMWMNYPSFAINKCPSSLPEFTGDINSKEDISKWIMENMSIEDIAYVGF